MKQIGIRVDDETAAGLEAIAREGGHRSVTTLAGTIIRDVVADDLAAHRAGAPAEPSAKVRRQGFMWWVVDGNGKALDGPFGSKAAAQEALP